MSVNAQYNLGMLVVFLILFIILSFERIKRIIFDLNVKKIFGIEFGEFEKETIKENIREEIEGRGIELSPNEINVITEVALNQITGVANKARYYDEFIEYALKDLSTDFLKELKGGVGKDRFFVDFVVELEKNRVLGIECYYSDRFYLPKEKIDQLIYTVDAFKKADNLSHFILITNTTVRKEDKDRLKLQDSPIDVIDNTITPDAILSRLRVYLSKIDKNRKGSLEKGN